MRLSHTPRLLASALIGLAALALPVASLTFAHPAGATSPNAATSASLWAVNQTGQVYAYGSANYYGNAPTSAPAAGIAATPDAGGYWVIDDLGDTYALGDANYLGNISSPDAAIVGLATANGLDGYWAVSASGGVFAQGDAQFHGSLHSLNISVTDVVGLVPTWDAGGYWVIETDGSVHAFGDAPARTLPANSHVVSVAATTGGPCTTAGCTPDVGFQALTSASGQYTVRTVLAGSTLASPSTAVVSGAMASGPAATGVGWLAPPSNIIGGTIAGVAATGQTPPPSYTSTSPTGIAAMTSNNLAFPAESTYTNGAPAHVASPSVSSITCISACPTTDTSALATDGTERVLLTGTGFQQSAVPAEGLQLVDLNGANTQLLSGVSVTSNTSATATLGPVPAGDQDSLAIRNAAGTTRLTSPPFSLCDAPGAYTLDPPSVSIYGGSVTVRYVCGSADFLTVDGFHIALTRTAGNLGVGQLPALPSGSYPSKLTTAGGVSTTRVPIVYSDSGYWEVASDGGIFSFGVPFEGSAGNITLNKPIVGMATPRGHAGYWLVASDGGIFNYGASFYGSMGGSPLAKPIVGIAATPDGHGYWEVASDGGIFSFGDATFYGSTGGQHLNQPIVGMAATPDGHGYWMVASDGGVFAFGDAHFYGSTGGTHLNKPVVAMAADPSTGGYWLVASDGGIFSYNAPFDGSTGNITLNQPIVGMGASPTGGGYILVASDGGVFAYGDSAFLGSMGGTHLNKPVVGIATIAPGS